MLELTAGSMGVKPLKRQRFFRQSARRVVAAWGAATMQAGSAADLLEPIGANPLFASGAYGSDDEDRYRLPPDALVPDFSDTAAGLRAILG
jgi:hypothetical protein